MYNNIRKTMTPDRIEMVMLVRPSSDPTEFDRELRKLGAAQSVGKAKAPPVQAARAGEQQRFSRSNLTD